MGLRITKEEPVSLQVHMFIQYRKSMSVQDVQYRNGIWHELASAVKSEDLQMSAEAEG